jgi:hypothetical protein
MNGLCTHEPPGRLDCPECFDRYYRTRPFTRPAITPTDAGKPLPSTRLPEAWVERDDEAEREPPTDWTAAAIVAGMWLACVLFIVVWALLESGVLRW